MSITNLITTFLAIGTLAIGTHSVTAQSTDRYIGVDAIASAPSNSFSGFNTAGGFDNRDTQSAEYAGLSFTYGVRDALTWRGMAITPEVELAWFSDYNTVSASFPGLPNPSFFYRSNIQTGRLGVNFWSPFAAGTDWRTELGVGLGAVYREFSTDDNVVQGTSSGLTPYGLLGVRYLKDIGEKGRLTVGVNVVTTGDSKLALSTGFGPAGDLSVKTTSPEIRIGYQFLLGK